MMPRTLVKANMRYFQKRNDNIKVSLDLYNDHYMLNLLVTLCKHDETGWLDAFPDRRVVPTFLIIQRCTKMPDFGAALYAL